MDPALLQFVGSLLAILVLAWIAKRLGLGAEEAIRDEAHARLLADEVVSGFEPEEVAISEDRKSAMLKDASGSVMVLRAHGNKFAGRVLGPGSGATMKDGSLHVLTGDRRFGDLSIQVTNAPEWRDDISALASTRRA